MSIDLYRDDLSRISPTELYDAVTTFVRLDDALEQRPREGYLLDFKEEWGDRALRSVAAFANTFGGLLIVGISEKDGRPDKLVGINSGRSEEKTRIASSIAANISPTPPFEVEECALLADTSKLIFVIRVRKGNALHLLTKKGEQPVYVRNEDQSRPADAAQLRSLIERRFETNRIESELGTRIGQFQQALVVNYSGNLVSTTLFRVILIPLSRVRLDLDISFENRFRGLVYSSYPVLRSRLERGIAEDGADRGQDWYDLRWRHREHDYERRWRITATCDFGFVTQVKWPFEFRDHWSFYDIAVDLICTVQAAKAVWESAGYYGEAQLHADLNVNRLSLFTPEKYPFGLGSLLYGANDSMDKTCLTPTGQPGNQTAVNMNLNFASVTSELADCSASVLNQLARGLKHGADLGKLRRESEYLLGKIPAMIRGASYG